MFRLTKLADYGIVIMTHLAQSQAQDRAQASTQEIAHATCIPQPMAGKILKSLARAGLLRSQRGAHGGYELSRPATAITVAEVIEALEGPIAITECVEAGPGCDLHLLCPARTNWQRINDAIRDALGGVSIDEMARGIPEAFLHAHERHAHERHEQAARA
ncbi:MAG: SUF system Fe-S cluster assembly regulator [Geminicoccaceae bacterium]|nr:SUF system Fe-S cluster assembly regulator [Geminicoccaceae bacterium]